jgi:hypothetical protein
MKRPATPNKGRSVSRGRCVNSNNTTASTSTTNTNTANTNSLARGVSPVRALQKTSSQSNVKQVSSSFNAASMLDEMTAVKNSSTLTTPAPAVVSEKVIPTSTAAQVAAFVTEVAKQTIQSDVSSMSTPVTKASKKTSQVEEVEEVQKAIASIQQTWVDIGGGNSPVPSRTPPRNFLSPFVYYSPPQHSCNDLQSNLNDEDEEIAMPLPLQLNDVIEATTNIAVSESIAESLLPPTTSTAITAIAVASTTAITATSYANGTAFTPAVESITCPATPSTTFESQQETDVFLPPPVTEDFNSNNSSKKNSSSRSSKKCKYLFIYFINYNLNCIDHIV